MASVPMTHRVFVYGSLKRGQWNHPLLNDLNAVFKGETVTQQRFHMLNGSVAQSRRFPVLLEDHPASSARAVAGEIYHVNDECLAQMDRLERVPDSYERKVVDVTEDGHAVQAFIYVGNALRWSNSGWSLWTGTNDTGALDWNEE